MNSRQTSPSGPAGNPRLTHDRRTRIVITGPNGEKRPADVLLDKALSRHLRLLVLTVAATVALAGCAEERIAAAAYPNRCPFTNDGACDEPILCGVGTDAADCRGGTGPGETPPGPDSCRYANDGECDEPILCASGTDRTDCAMPDAPIDPDHGWSFVGATIEGGTKLPAFDPSGEPLIKEPPVIMTSADGSLTLTYNASSGVTAVRALTLGGRVYRWDMAEPTKKPSIRFRRDMGLQASTAPAIQQAFDDEDFPPIDSLDFQTERGSHWKVRQRGCNKYVPSHVCGSCYSKPCAGPGCACSV